MNSLELIGAQSIYFIDEQIDYFRSLFFQSLISMQMEIKSMKKTQVVVICLSCSFFKRETVDCAVFQRWFG